MFLINHIGKIKKVNGENNLYTITSEKQNESKKRDSRNNSSKKSLNKQNSFKLLSDHPIEKNCQSTNKNTEIKESTQAKEILETNPTLNDQKTVASAKNLETSKDNNVAKFEAPKTAAAVEKSNLNVTKVIKSGKNNSLKGILNMVTLNKILDSKMKKNTNDSSKSSNKANISADTSLNKSNTSTTNKSNLRPNSTKGSSNEIAKSKDNISSKNNATSKISNKVSTANKDKNPIGSLAASNKNQQKVSIPKEIKDSDKQSLENPAKNLIKLEEKESKQSLETTDLENQIINKKKIIEPEKIEIKNKTENTKSDLALGGIILNKTNRNSFEELSDLKKTFTERKLSPIDNNKNKIQISEIKEINSELQKEDSEKIKQLEEKRKKLYSKLGYDVIEPQDSMSKSNNFRQRKSDLDVFQNVNIKKLASLLERRFNGNVPEIEGVVDKVNLNAEEKPVVEEKIDTGDFIKLNINKEKRKPTQKRFSLV